MRVARNEPYVVEKEWLSYFQRYHRQGSITACPQSYLDGLEVFAIRNPSPKVSLAVALCRKGAQILVILWPLKPKWRKDISLSRQIQSYAARPF